MIDTHRDITAGHKRRMIDLPGVRLIEASYPHNLYIPPHTHLTANVTVVLSGALDETSANKTKRCGPGSVVLKPAGLAHSNRFSNRGARTLVIEVLGDDRPDSPHDASRWDYRWTSGGSLTATMIKLFRSFRTRDPETLNSEVAGVFDILSGEVGPSGEQLPEKAPAWLQDISTLIQARITEPIQVKEIAKLAGTHPVYLTRLFQRYHGSSVSEFVHRRRAEHVATLLADSNTPLCDIAESSGYADQAHMTRSFKSQMGLTPGTFRRLLG